MEHRFDRSAEDVGNVVSLEHVNTRIPDQRLATLFYMSGLGLTRDPYLMTGVDNMWANVGRSQFHLPTGGPQVVRGVVGLVLPEREALLRRLAAVKKPLEGTRFSFQEHDGYVEAVCPWGNRIRCHVPGPRFGRMALGLPYVELPSPSARPRPSRASTARYCPPRPAWTRTAAPRGPSPRSARTRSSSSQRAGRSSPNSTATTSRSIWRISPGPTGASWSAV